MCLGLRSEHARKKTHINKQTNELSDTKIKRTSAVKKKVRRRHLRYTIKDVPQIMTTISYLSNFLY